MSEMTLELCIHVTISSNEWSATLLPIILTIKFLYVIWAIYCLEETMVSSRAFLWSPICWTRLSSYGLLLYYSTIWSTRASLNTFYTGVFMLRVLQKCNHQKGISQFPNFNTSFIIMSFTKFLSFLDSLCRCFYMSSQNLIFFAIKERTKWNPCIAYHTYKNIQMP
jgi:hypothetical protein